MRAGFGLLGLLVAAAIVFWVSFGPLGGSAKHGYEGEVLTQGKNARDQAEQVSGRDENGAPAGDSVKTEAVEAGGQFRRMKVVSLVPGGPFEKAYKLKPGDEITDIGGLGVDMNNDYGMARARLDESIARNEPMTVVRDGQKVTLTPDTALSQFHPDLFGKPAATAVPSH